MNDIERAGRLAGARRTAVAWCLGAFLALGAAMAACTSSVAVTTGAGCSLNSDCAAGLSCAFGKCRAACVTSVDCGKGASCVDDGRLPVCQTPAEKNTPCTRLADCPTPLACASDYRCRNLCFSDADCNVLGISGRVCASDGNGVHYCADPNEVVNGLIVVLPPPGAPSTPVVEPEAGSAPTFSGPLIAVNVGAGGGTLGIGAFSVTIPAGVLSAPLDLTIQRSSLAGPAGTVGQVYDVGPSGTSFAPAGVTISFRYDDTELGGALPSDFAVATIENGVWTALPQVVVDVYAHTISGQTAHFSPFALVKLTAGSLSDAGTVPPAGGSEAGVVADGSGSAARDGGGGLGGDFLDSGPAFDATAGVRDSGGFGVADSSANLPGPVACPGNIATVPYVSEAVVQAAAPTPMGGPITDGEYVLRSIVLYDSDGLLSMRCPGSGSSPDAGAGSGLREEYTFYMGFGRFEVQLSGGMPAQCGAGTYAIVGNTIAPGMGQPVAYTAPAGGQTLQVIGSACSWGSATPDGGAGSSGSYVEVYTFTKGVP